MTKVGKRVKALGAALPIMGESLPELGVHPARLMLAMCVTGHTADAQVELDAHPAIVVDPPPTLSAKALTTQNDLQRRWDHSDDGCIGRPRGLRSHLTELAKQASDLMGETIEVIFDKTEKMPAIAFTLHPGIAIVPLLRPNSHDYPLGKPTVLRTDTHGVTIDSLFGNYLPIEPKYSPRESLRLATPEEIVEFVGTIELEKVFNLMGSIADWKSNNVGADEE